MKNKSFFGKIVVSFLTLVVSVVLGVIIMTVLYLFPMQGIVRHAKESGKLYGDGVDRINRWSGTADSTALSNFVESRMINDAIYRGYESPLDNAMMNPHAVYPDTFAYEEENFVRYLNDEEGYITKDYERYWHGYLLYIIPALEIFNVGEIKIMMMIIQFSLAMMTLNLMNSRERTVALFFLPVILFINPVTTILTLPEAHIYIIMLVFTYIVLRYNDKWRKNECYYYLFILNGILVAFFDAMTYPLVALGVPLITIFLINRFEAKETVRMVIVCSCAWIFGYGGMWAGKWIAGTILTGRNMLSDGFSTVAFRMNGTDMDAEGVNQNYFHVVKKMFDAAESAPMRVMMVLLALGIIIILAKKRNVLYSAFLENRSSIIASLIVGFSPFAWFFVVRNHSAIHPHFGYRELAVTLWGVLSSVLLVAYPSISENHTEELS